VAGAAISAAPTFAAKGKSSAVAEDRDAAKELDSPKELDKLKVVWGGVGYERIEEGNVDQQAKESMWNETLWFHSTLKKNWLNFSWERKGVGQTSAWAEFNLSASTPRAINLTWKSIPAKDFMP